MANFNIVFKGLSLIFEHIYKRSMLLKIKCIFFLSNAIV